MTRVLLVDDHAATRQPLAMLLGRETGITVAAQVGSVADARQALATTAIDLAVIDLGLPDGDGVDLIKDVKRANPAAEALILTAETDRGRLARAVAAGAAGVLHKSASLDEIIGAVHRLSVGEPVLSPAAMVELLRYAGQEREEQFAARLALGRLTAREREVLAALADGLSDKEIGRRLSVNEKTVRSHMASLLAKLEVDSRLQALIFAVRHGVIDIR